VNSKVKKVTIGAVPNRGGKPEGYTKKDPGEGGGASSASAQAAPPPKAQRGPRQRTFASGGESAGAAASTSTPAATPAGESSSATASATAPEGASSSASAPASGSSSTGGGHVLGGAGAGSAGASSAAATPASKEGESVAPKREEKTGPTGARSTNKDALKEYRVRKRQEWEGKVSNTYYEELEKHRKGA